MPHRVFFYVQHLLGLGHLVRSLRIARALEAAGTDVLLVMGGVPVAGLDVAGLRIVHLPPVRSGAQALSSLMHPDGRVFSEADKAARCAQLLGHFDAFAPDCLLIEAFPFGRRAMRFELLPLLHRAQARESPPLIVSSVRDILQRELRPARIDDYAALVQRFFDMVLVHGDPHLARFDETFAAADRIASRIAYTGIVAPPPLPPATHRAGVILSVGGGAVGAILLGTALRALPLSRLAREPCLVLTGPNMPQAQMSALAAQSSPNTTVETFVADLPQRLAAARLSISQAGYNSVADILVAGCASVLVPYADGGETEQSERATRLHARGLCVSVPAGTLSPAALATAIDAALDLPRAALPLNLDGARNSAALLAKALAARRVG